MNRVLAEKMPKVELHVHLEGSTRPETLLRLAERNGVILPANDTESIRNWYQFRDFPHFVEVYVQTSKCIRTPEDIELLATEFIAEQVRQNVLYSEVTFTASTIEKYAGIPWNEQIDALNRARAAAGAQGENCQFIIDIVRGDPVEKAEQVLEWVAGHLGNGVCALGLAGEERLGTAVYAEVFMEAQRRGVPVVAHAGETVGPESIRECLELAKAVRIGHGVRCLEDPALTKELVEQQIHLEVCPSSNVCLGVFPSLAEHPLPRMLDEGLNVSVNSDDPPMFSTSLTDEWDRVAREFDFSADIAFSILQNSINAALISPDRKATLRQQFREQFSAALDSEED